MSKFIIRRHFSLAHLGDGWENCFIDMSPLSYSEKQAWREFVGGTPEKEAEHTLEILKDHFIEGKAVTDKGVAPITAEDLLDLPEVTLIDCLDVLKGEGLSANFTTSSKE